MKDFRGKIKNVKLEDYPMEEKEIKELYEHEISKIYDEELFKELPSVRRFEHDME